MSLKGKVALVTGASDIPGNAIAVALAKAGAKVAVEGGPQVQERVLRVVETFGGDALPVRGSLTEDSGVSHILSNVEAIMGPVDILVNASGIRLSKSVTDSSADEWDQVLSSKVRAAFLCTKAVLPSMKQRGAGHIISVSSAQAIASYANYTALCASESALMGFSNALAREVSTDGIRVSVLCAAGPIAGQDGHGSSGINPEEIAQDVVYLASRQGKTSSTQLIVSP